VTQGMVVGGGNNPHGGNPNNQRGPEAQGLLNQGGGGGGQRGGKSPMGNMKMNLLWFAAACCVLIGGFIGSIDMLFTVFAPFDFLDEVYLFFFGGIMFVLDAPLNFKLILEVKQHIYKFGMFLTRLTGRGVFYIFLGTMTFATLWENSISYVLAVILGFFVFGVGMFSAIVGYVKSRKLERVRFQVFQNKQNGKLNSMYTAFAKTSPQVGLTKQEFNELSSQLKGVSWDPDELNIIFNALTTGPQKESQNISMMDLSDWCEGDMTWL